MVQRVSTVAFEGIEARAVDVQVQVSPGLPAFNILWAIKSHAILQKWSLRSALEPIPMSACRPTFS